VIPGSDDLLGLVNAVRFLAQYEVGQDDARAARCHPRAHTELQ
jgi:hypothetical protein